MPAHSQHAQSDTAAIASSAKRWRTAFASLLSVTGLAAIVPWRATPLAAPMTVTVRGVVRNAATNAGIPSARVTIMPDAGTAAATTTSSDGRYQVQVPVTARGVALNVQVTAIGYRLTRAQARATADIVTIDVRMAVDNATLAVAEDAVAPSTAAVKAVTGAAAIGRNMPSPTTRQNIMPMSAPPMPSMKRMAAESRAADRRIDRSVRAPFDSSRAADWNREQYDRILDNPFLAVKGNPRSTFSADVDRASYGNVRRFLTQGQLPPADAVRIEELVNYFPYHLDEPRGDAPVAITTEATPAPWQRQHQLVRIALQARRISTANLPPSNLVFLIDVSGSMESPDKLPLVKASLRLLVEQLRPQDRVALVVYAGNAGVVLPSTDGNEKSRIMEAIDRLEAGGSTAGGAGLELAYKVAREHFARGGNNRVILATDGDFNVGPSSDAEMERLIERKRDEGTYLTVLGFGTGNYQDAKMKKMAKIGNGNYAYVDQLDEARKTLVHEMGATLLTVANDVKLQVEFNPTRVASYRLIGYEDRLLRDEDFTDDKKDAGDMGAGHTVTALYEVVPVGVRGTVKVRETDPLRYTPEPALDGARDARSGADSDELLYVKLRYKTPGEATSKLLSKAVRVRDVHERASDDLRFAAAVASFGMLLRNSEYKGDASAASVLNLARGSAESDEDGYRGEFVSLVQRWQQIAGRGADRPISRER